MLLTKEVEIKVAGRTLRRYRDFGYKCNVGDNILVKVEHLPKCSHIKVQCLCDYCKENISEKTYDKYNKEREIVSKDCCTKCANNKNQEIFEKKYGVKSPLQLEKIKEKTKETNQKKYGVDNPTLNPLIRQKQEKTNIERYGTPNPLENKKIREKIKNTMMERYGVENPFSNGPIREKSYYKTLITKANNNNISTSKAQEYLGKLYNAQLNVVLKYYAVDLYFEGTNIYGEYDGGGHCLPVKLGQMTEEEFNKKEMQRYHIIKRAGYKMFKIINMTSKEKLPSDEILLQIKKIAFDYLQQKGHNFIVFNIDDEIIKTKVNTYSWDYETPFDESIEII